MSQHASILQCGTIHIIGIGGIGMSGIAEILHALGCKVQGSDMAENANVTRLREKNIQVFIGQHGDHIKHADLVVKSTAIKDINPEVMAAKKAGLKVIHRAEMLAEIMRLKDCISIAGTHGKTTTTTLMATLFDKALPDSSVLNGGVINAYGSNAKWADGQWMIVEADESDGTFIRIPSKIAVVTNIDPEHLEHYGSFEALKAAFETFVSELDEGGFAVICADQLHANALAERVAKHDILTYGAHNEQADIVASNIEPYQFGSRFDVCFSDKVNGKAFELKQITLALPGHHNVLNALAVLAIGARLGFDKNILATALSDCQGVQRRFTAVGEFKGATIIDDYAHHPVEIAATLQAAENVAKCQNGKVIAVMQPHRYTRLSALFNEFSSCFELADHILIADVFAAGEESIEGMNADTLIEAIRQHGAHSVSKLESQQTLAPQLADILTEGDVVVCMGAGSITYWARSLADELKVLTTQTVV